MSKHILEASQIGKVVCYRSCLQNGQLWRTQTPLALQTTTAAEQRLQHVCPVLILLLLPTLGNIMEPTNEFIIILFWYSLKSPEIVFKHMSKFGMWFQLMTALSCHYVLFAAPLPHSSSTFYAACAAAMCLNIVILWIVH